MRVVSSASRSSGGAVNAVGFDADLVRRYDVNGPRYTSYPTANLFSERFTAASYAEALQRLHDLLP